MTERLRVLFVEDNPADIDLIREMLPETGPVSFRLESVSRLSEAFSRLEGGDIDLVLLDLGLPDSHGLQTFHKLREAAPDIPTVVLTGNTDQKTAIAAVREGAQDYFVKGEVSGSRLARAARYAVERQRAKEALRRTEENFRRSLDESPLGVRIVTAEGETLYANRAILDIYGYDSIEELRATPVKTRYTPESYTQFLKRKEQRDRGELDFPDYEISIIRKNGEVRHLRVFRKEVLWDGEKQYQAIYLDVTDRQRAEEALRESERKLKTLFEILPVGISILDAERKIVYGNPALATILDLPGEGLLRGDYTKRKYLRPDGTPMPAEEFASTRAIKEQRAVHNVETGVVKEDDNVIWTNVSAVPVAFPDWKVVIVTSDITERREAQQKLKEALGKLQLSLRGIIQVISRIVEMRDSYTAGHQRRVTALGRAIALEMGLAEDRVEGLVMAGNIHDLGKISVPTEILSKPTRLTVFEFQLIRNHPRTAYDIFKEIDFPWPIAEIVLQHHERMDGSGYPQGLRGADILLEARILAVADVVEAISSHRPYRPALGINAALEELEQKKGILYDPEVVKACLTLFREKGFTFQ
jgi:PAS domain S-box-containing protein